MDAVASNEWKQYGKTLIESMRELLNEVNDDRTHSLLLETADFWLSVGLTIGVRDPAAASRLLAIVEAHDEGRAELEEDALAFCAGIVR